MRKPTTVDSLVNLIRDRIHTGDYPVGYLFPPQKQLAVDLECSVSTVREAIAKLTTLGYLKSKQGVGTTVESSSQVETFSEQSKQVSLSSGNVFHFIETRICLEKFIVRLAARKITPDDFARLEFHIEQNKKAIAERDAQLFIDSDKRFHKEFFIIAKNPLLLQFMEIIQDEYHAFIEKTSKRHSVMVSAVDYHTRIVQALREQNLQTVERLLVEHLWEVLKLTDFLQMYTALNGLFEEDLLREGVASPYEANPTFPGKLEG